MAGGLQDGLLGFLLFVSHWIAPQNNQAELSSRIVKFEPPHIEVRTNLDLALNTQMEQLIDAGIPLRFRIKWAGDDGDTVVFIRTLKCDIVNYTYAFTDSSQSGKNRSRNYPLIYLALKDYCRWEARVPSGSKLFWTEAAILPSRADRLDRMVDMSSIWGRRKISHEVKLIQKTGKEQ